MTTTAIFVLGDQLSLRCGAFNGLSPQNAFACISERLSESRRPTSHKARSAYFIACMRRFSAKLANLGWSVRHRRLDDTGQESLWDDLAELAIQGGATRARCARPGEHGLIEKIEQACAERGLPIEWVEDGKFILGTDGFLAWAKGRSSMLQEAFYRHMRAKTGLLMDPDGSPTGGKWNFDLANRSGYPKSGPGLVPPRPIFERLASDQEALDDIERLLASNPGSLEAFNWPLDEEQAQIAALAFLDDKLPGFGLHQDAMWDTEPFGHHALLSAPLNLGLLDPLWLCQQAQARHHAGLAGIESTEGFIRQVLGWREYIHGMYWLRMPGLARSNHMKASLPLPAWFWDASATKMNCMRASIGQTMEHAHAHHIQRLMVIGNFCLTAGIAPAEVSDWFGGIYVDAVEWVHMPNVLGMALHADGGDLATKPYMAGGSYISKQSNYCKGCAYDPKVKSGPKACPMSVLYWHATDKHQAMLASNARTAMPAKQWQNMDPQAKAVIQAEAARMLADLDNI